MIKYKVLAVIPVRMSSQRLPGKPLKDIAGKTLVQRVWERGKLSKNISKLVIATDSQDIRDQATSIGAEVVMTSSEITTGSQRVAACWNHLKENDWDMVVNLQGDMPFIKAELLDRCIEFLAVNKERFVMATVATPILDREVFLSNSVVKVVVSSENQALYFSRSAIPHSRDGNLLSYRMPNGKKIEVYGFKHFGLYVFQPKIMKEYLGGDLSPLEDVEKLEQLRLLEKGYPIGVCVVDPDLTADSVEVDTASDLEKANQIARK